MKWVLYTSVEFLCEKGKDFYMKGVNKKAPDYGAKWVKDGARTRDLQNHNLAF